MGGFCIFLAFAAGLSLPAPAAEEIEFNRDIRPILSEYCFACHGPDEQGKKGGLRLDLPGSEAIVPGDAAASELVARVIAKDADDLMPPPETHKKLSATQIEILRRWIDEGAVYQRHWAFEPPRQAPLPVLDDASNPIDAFVSAKLKQHGLDFAPEAPEEVLRRRVSLDLTGLPPGGEGTSGTYEQLVDRLLASPHFGERMAVAWLDAARYADTNGYFGDKPRQMWLWRDWVIDALNSNMPFDQFTIEQLAGDLLPGATLRQRVATGFNRNHMVNNESGSIDEEFRVEYVVDRVDTTMTVWQGLTAGCAQCHDHKYDPISQREFFQLFAFFNNVPEKGLVSEDNPPPLLSVPTPEQERQLVELAAASRRAVEAFTPIQRDLAPRITVWEQEAPDALPALPTGALLHESFDGAFAPEAVAAGTYFEFEAGLRGEADSVFESYGPQSRQPGTFAANCLLARRMAERGVRFIQLYHRGWDQHYNLPSDLRLQCGDIDQPCAALIRDLKQRGMLEDTLVVWGGEFGPTTYSQGKLEESNHGRDHHGRCFTMWLAGGGVRPGIQFGETDDFCYNIVRDPVHVHDLNATLLHQLGINHERLVYRFQGRDFRLTDVHGHVVKGMLA